MRGNLSKTPKNYRSELDQVDYNQNDPTKSDYIKNRPIFDEIIETKNESVSIKYDGKEDFVSISRGTALGLIPGNIYKLQFLGYKGDVLQDTYIPSPDRCKAAMGSSSLYVKLEFRDNNDWVATILDTTSSYVMDKKVPGKLIKRLFPYFATWFDSECDNYELVITGDFSRVETMAIPARGIESESLLKLIDERAMLTAPLLKSPSGDQIFQLVVNEDGVISTEDVTDQFKREV